MEPHRGPVRVVAGYELADELHSSRRSLVCRGRRQEDARPVVLKLLQPSSTAEDGEGLRSAYEVLRALRHPGVPTPLELLRHEGRLALVVEDAGGTSVDRLLKRQRLALRDVVTLAIGVGDALAHVHGCDVVHRDIRPSHIVVDERTTRVQIIDFESASRSSDGARTEGGFDRWRGTLAFASPEVAGRRAHVDHRADLYSLGATVFYLLAGRLPFDETDPLALAHAHAAVQPPDLREIAPDVPVTITRVVMKLLAKSPNGRYQSANALTSDLRECLETLEQTDQESPAFVLGRYDPSPRFQVSGRLRGRETQLSAVLASFDQAQRGGASLVLVSGSPGVGKSTLAMAARADILRRGGTFLSGKFDQFQNVPYAALLESLRGFVRDVLTEPQDELARWREHIERAIGSAVPVLVDRLPELEAVVGPQPPLPEVSPSTAFNRLQSTVAALVGVVCARRGRLAIFLDDLQWAGAASVQLLRAILESAEVRGLLVIGAYRSSEVDAAHPLSALKDDLKGSRVDVREVPVQPLARPDVDDLVADTLSLDVDAVRPLSALTYARTHGDPFFVRQFLSAAHKDGSIRFDPQIGRWTWDQTRIERLGVADNVAAFVARKLRDLPPATRALVNLAAARGAQVSVALLGRASDLAPGVLSDELRPAVQDDILMPTVVRRTGFGDAAGEAPAESAGYRFTHDRVQQAAYELFAEDHRQRNHLVLGRLLLPDDPEDRSEGFFDAVNQLNAGSGAMSAPGEQERLCVLNLAAGRAARDAAAFSEASAYLKKGLALLPPDAWTAHETLTLNLHLAGAEVASLVSDFDEMGRLLEATGRVTRPEVQAKVAQIQVLAEKSRGSLQSAVDRGLEGLRRLGVRVPRRPGALYVMWELLRTRVALWRRPPERLLGRPPASKPEIVGALELLGEVYNATYLAEPSLFPVLTFKMVQLAVRDGVTPITSLAFANYALLTVSASGRLRDAVRLLILGDPIRAFRLLASGDWKRGLRVAAFGGRTDAARSWLVVALGGTHQARRFSDLALALADLPACRRYRPRTLLVIYDFVLHWQRMYPDALIVRPTAEGDTDPLLHVFQEARGIGDLDTAAWLSVVGLLAMTNSGASLTEVAEWANRYGAAIRSQQTASFMFDYVRQRVLNLIGDSAGDPCELTGEAFDETAIAPQNTNQHADTLAALCGYHMVKAWLAFLMHRNETARHEADKAVPLLMGLAGSLQEIQFFYYDSLIHLRTAPARGWRRLGALWLSRAHLSKLEDAAARHGVNFTHWVAIVSAERARVRGRDREAERCYEQAIAHARAHGRLEDEAVATELAGRFHLARGRVDVGQAYLRAAYEKFARWGAAAKLKALAEELPFVSTDVRARASHPSLGQLDALSLLKAGEAMSREIVMADLLTRLIDTVVESAGANRASLLLYELGELYVAAEVRDAGEPPSVGLHVPLSEAPNLPLSVVRYVARTGHTVVVGDHDTDRRFADDEHFARSRSRSVLCMPIGHQQKRVGVLYLENTLASDAFSPDRVEVLNALSGQMAISLDNSRLYERLEGLLKAQSRFVPAQFLRALGRDDIEAVGLGDHVAKELSILFSDIRNFTTMVETITPAESISFINDYLGRMETAIVDCGGFVDSYIGDGIMALFDADADRAVEGAIGMLRALGPLNHLRSRRGQPPVRAGIGIHTGTVMLGTIGGENHLKCGVIGDAVNVASRVEGLTKRYGVSILITGQTFARLHDSAAYRTRQVDRVRVAGRSAPLELVEVLEGDDTGVAAKLHHLDLFTDAVRCYYERRMDAALALFQRYAGLVPDDPVAGLFLDRCHRHLTASLSVDWDGVDTVLSK
jgi:predicted ATPase/class 3 adenylate cyclase